jgi:N-acetylmuramoyl-L-alanine amidase
LKSLLRQRGLWSAFVAIAIFGAIATPPAHARARHSDSWARERFAAAGRLREALNGRPPAERSRHDYQRVLNAYRLVYNGAPSSSKADPSVVAVAETLVEMGRRFDDDKILHEAIAQYRFLRREYPGSKYRFEALFTIGEIYQDDLNDPQSASAAFREFLRHYPRNRLAADARQAIAALERPAVTASDSQKTAADRVPEKNKSATEVAESDKASGGSAKDAKAAENDNRPPTEDDSAPDGESAKNESSQVRLGHLARVTGIRHWSSPDYTRVAIDLESDVQFTSQRISHPARIYFDLRDTRLASTLVGKSFDVDDGFLKKVRVAQFAPRRTRIVLEVDNLSDYDAFLLPNPSRLIIDIHGKSERGNTAKKDVAAEADSAVQPEAKDSEDKDEVSDNEVSTPTNSLSPAGPPESRGSVGKESGDSDVSSMPAPRLGTPPHNGIVKRIVEADDDDDDVAESASPAPSAKHNVRRLQSADSGERESVDLKNDSATVATLSATGRSGRIASPHKPYSRKLATGAETSEFSVREAKPTESGDRSLIRALGLKIGKIVIDPGHGGHDTGTIGPDGLEEKDLVLDVGRRLGKLLEARLGSEVVYTRKDDTFIPLETRTAIANQARADLFISIHANSSHDAAARGVETYYLNFTSSPDALEVAARENAVSETSIYELQDLVKKIALKDKIEESREFAWDVQESLHAGLAARSPAIRDRGVKKAPFIVLIGANMPSILAEISFVSNPTDERRLITGEYREQIAESLYRGIAKYANGLSGVKVASKIDKDAGQ